MNTCHICLLGNHNLVEKTKHTTAAHSDKYDYIFIKHPHMSQFLGQVLGTKHFISSGEFFTRRFSGPTRQLPRSPQKKSAGQRLQTQTRLTFNLQPVSLPAGNRNSYKKSEVTGSVSSIKENAGGRMGRCIKRGQVSPATREEVTKARSQSSALFCPGSLSSNPVSSLADSLASSYSVRAASLQLQC